MYSYPYDLAGFKIKCSSSTTVTAIWPGLTAAQLTKYRKATNLTPGLASTFGYYDLPVTPATINGHNAVKYTLTDGQKGDSTAVDGFIIDPAGPATPVADPNIDTDGDGTPDATDPNPTNACIPMKSAPTCDLDNDGLPNSIDTDDDGDGATDAQEAAANTNPYDASSRPAVPCTTPNTGNNYCCTQPAPAPTTSCGCGSGCCGGSSSNISNINNTNSVNISNGSGVMFSPVYNMNNMYNSPVNFTSGPINFTVNKVPVIY
jgi:Bacterial TSP3 repeat